MTTGSQFFVRDRFNIAPGDEFGFALAAGRFNEDVTAELAIGAPGVTISSRADTGAVHVLYGQAGLGLSRSAGPGEQVWSERSFGISNPFAAGDRFGSSLSAWNFGRNQLVGLPVRVVSTSDLAIGIPGVEVVVGIPEIGLSEFTDAGAVRVIYGSTGGLSITTGVFGAVGPAQFWTQGSPGVPDDPESGDGFGTGLY